jgi:hypothetical protein
VTLMHSETVRAHAPAAGPAPLAPAPAAPPQARGAVPRAARFVRRPWDAGDDAPHAARDPRAGV